MSHYDDKLRALQEKTARCHPLRALLTELRELGVSEEELLSLLKGEEAK